MVLTPDFCLPNVRFDNQLIFFAHWHFDVYAVFTKFYGLFFQIDDAEFDIPPVDKTPTLESILNELEDQGSLSDEEISPLLNVGEVCIMS